MILCLLLQNGMLCLKLGGKTITVAAVSIKKTISRISDFSCVKLAFFSFYPLIEIQNIPGFFFIG